MDIVPKLKPKGKRNVHSIYDDLAKLAFDNEDALRASYLKRAPRYIPKTLREESHSRSRQMSIDSKTSKTSKIFQTTAMQRDGSRLPSISSQDSRAMRVRIDDSPIPPQPTQEHREESSQRKPRSPSQTVPQEDRRSTTLKRSLSTKVPKSSRGLRTLPLRKSASTETLPVPIKVIQHYEKLLNEITQPEWDIAPLKPDWEPPKVPHYHNTTFKTKVDASPRKIIHSPRLGPAIVQQPRPSTSSSAGSRPSFESFLSSRFSTDTLSTGEAANRSTGSLGRFLSRWPAKTSPKTERFEIEKRVSVDQESMYNPSWPLTDGSCGEKRAGSYKVERTEELRDIHPALRSETRAARKEQRWMSPLAGGDLISGMLASDL